MVEFALVAVMLFLVIFGIVEMERMLLVYDTLSHATRAATRYAIVHGHDRSGTGADGPSSVAPDDTYVKGVVTYLAGAGTLKTENLTVHVTYTACAACTNVNDPGSTVTVQTAYVYDPFTVLPLSVTLGSTSQGVITY